MKCKISRYFNDKNFERLCEDFGFLIKKIKNPAGRDPKTNPSIFIQNYA
jgi:hypothetical protein